MTVVERNDENADSHAKVDAESNHPRPGHLDATGQVASQAPAPEANGNQAPSDDGGEASRIAGELRRHIEDLEMELRRLRIVLYAALRFLLPASALGALLLLVLILHPNTYANVYGTMLVFAFTPAGKFTASLAISQGLGVLETVFLLGSIDVIVGWFLTWNFPALHRVPRLGMGLRRLEKAGQRALIARPWIARMAFMGLVLLVAVPFQGTGAISGAIVGRLMGFGSARTVAAIAIGGYGGVAAVAGTSRGISALADRPLIQALVIAAVVIGVGFLAWLWRRGNKARVSA